MFYVNCFSDILDHSAGSRGTSKREQIWESDIFIVHVPGGFEYSEKSGTTEHTDAQRGHDLGKYQDSFYYATDHHKAVKAIKQRHKISLEA
jgi:hypothetical protein